MPFLIPLIPALAALTGAAALAAAVALTVVEMAALYFLSKLLAPSPPGTQLSAGSTEEYNGTVTPRRLIYGTNLVAGLNAIPPWCHGTNNQMLDQVLVIAGHECAAILDCFANQEFIASSSITNVSYTLNDGLVTTGTFANKLWIRRYTGAPGEAVDTILYSAWPGSWDVNHIGTGLAKLCVQFQFDTTVYSGGKAEIRAIVKGKKVYDPRLDTAPGANPTNASYIKYSPNPALCICDYILDPVLGIGEAATRIDWASAVAAANLCDEFVSVPLNLTTVPAYDNVRIYSVGDSVQVGGIVYACTVVTVGHTPPNATYWAPMAVGAKIQRRYTCDTVLDCTESYENNLRTLAAAYQGAVLYSAGKWVLLPGHYVTPTFAIGPDDIAGGFDYQTAVPFASRYNAVRGQFYDPTNLYQPTEYPPIRVSADEIADGEGPVWKELQQATCTDMFEAQRNAMIEQRKSRRRKTWSFPATYAMYSIRPGDFGTLTIPELSISGQYVQCTGWKLDGKAMTMALSLQEVTSTDWNDPAVAVYQTLNALATPAPANFISDPVSGLTAKGGAGGITFKWTMPAIWHSNLSVELLECDFNNRVLSTVIWSGVNNGIFIAKADTVTRYYWVQIRNFAGNTVSVPVPLLVNGGLAASAASSSGPQGPAGPTGATGSGGLVGSLTLSAVVLPASAAGHVTDYSAAIGTFKVYVGTVDVTANCSFGLAPLGNPSNLTFGIGGNTDFGIAVSYSTQTTAAVGSVAAGANQVLSFEGQTTAATGTSVGGGAITTREGQSTAAVGAVTAAVNNAATREGQSTVASGLTSSAGVTSDAGLISSDSGFITVDAGSGAGTPPPVSGTATTKE